MEEHKQWALWQMMEQGFNCPATSSCGRFFDGIAALLGVCLTADYEGQAAMELESLARRAMAGTDLAELLENCSWQSTTVFSDHRLIWQQDILVQEVLNQLSNGRDSAAVALDFHLCLIQSLFQLLCKLAAETGITQVVLTGGCMQNTLLLEGLFILLERNVFTVYTGMQIPVNDGGIALGQAIIGGLRHVSGSTHESN